MPKITKGPALRARPVPPDLSAAPLFAPAPEVSAWVQEHLIAEGGAIHNPDHAHLDGADLAFLWAADSYESKGRTVVGTAEQVAFRCSAWQRLRQEQQLEQWFGRVPEYLITLSAGYAARCTDIEWCALVEHELYHVAQQQGDDGEPLFDRDGNPKLRIVAHDVEEFVGVVRRYGAGNPDGGVARLVRAAQRPPEVSARSLAGACGTCLRLVA